MIPPDSDGYTGTLLRSVTGSGKNTLYIVPLQHEFDLTPLPPDAIEECMESQSSAEDIEVNVALKYR